jgi:hypothetical protein
MYLPNVMSAAGCPEALGPAVSHGAGLDLEVVVVEVASDRLEVGVEVDLSQSNDF